MLQKQLLILFTLFYVGICYYCKDDQCATFKIQNNTQVKFQIINRSLFGGTRVTISKLNDSKTYFDFFSYVRGTQTFYSVHPLLRNTTFNNTKILLDQFIKKQVTLFQLPISYHINFQGYDFYFDILEFLQVFNTTFNVRIQMSTYTPLNEPTFELPVVNEDYSFTVSLSNFTKEIVYPVKIFNKLTSIHPAWVAINLGLYTFQLFLILCFATFQPLKSRGAIVYFNYVFQVLMEVATIYSFIPLQTQQKDEIQVSVFYFQILFDAATTTTECFVVVGLFYRFLILMFLNQRKMLFHIQDKVVKMKWYWRVLKFSGEVWITIITTIVFYFSIGGILWGYSIFC